MASTSAPGSESPACTGPSSTPPGFFQKGKYTHSKDLFSEYPKNMFESLSKVHFSEVNSTCLIEWEEMEVEGASLY